ncbi:Angio-associated migratory cell protein [Zootermopsis nevadensis]|uniref:Angio-associated migratory cell protein n=1 Tax=Zootermopsis nevadensis TaxID=136037 RepID=A0A067QKL5_ZOONE|nr:Angio-associated migratory cell protein [Zootermopsis nevadensis]
MRSVAVNCNRLDFSYRGGSTEEPSTCWWSRAVVEHRAGTCFIWYLCLLATSPGGFWVTGRSDKRMTLKDTPPTSPCSNETMDYNELFEDEVEEVIDGEAASSNNYIEANDASDEDIGIGLEGSENSEGNNPVRDDSASVFSHHKGSVFCCHLQPKAGRLAVTGAEDDMAYVWETHSGEVVLQCKGHKDSVTCVRFNYDGSYVATGDMSGVIQVWKIANKLQVWETCIGDLTWLRWHHGANVLLAGTESGEVYVWRIPGGECKVLPGHGDKADCGLMLPDGKRMAIGYADGSLKIFDTKTATVLHHVPQGQAHTGTITDMDCHPDNNLLISSSVDGHAVVLKTQTGKILGYFDDPFFKCLSTAGNNFSLALLYRHSVGLLGQGISPSQGLYLYTGQHNTEKRGQTSMA